ncbi:TetR/AcrR family transcriptional regulator [Zhihengliuella halotolerans]|uniref:TetR family transcriptional regulator n=1 Tax=Zhihengliuella halotolerans TaxID=370736 RepID=A0A4Q8AFC0_9MICC|nr:TetR/AcrR family transcriptional regulator [Zhihengliuella halotolerans]RZU62551.1 TetR family transcriptional regulator [Zhihengliuella halotolerans]
MPRPPAAREKILAAYCEIVAGDGERAATMDATAARAGVSKGGLLYHFKSKDALADGVIERLAEAAEADLARMKSFAEGPSRYFVRTSVETGTELDTFLVVVMRLAAAQHPGAVEALSAVHGSWWKLIRDEVGDDSAADAIMLLGDGIYHHASLPGASAPGSTASYFRSRLESVLEQVDRLKPGA